MEKLFQISMENINKKFDYLIPKDISMINSIKKKLKLNNIVQQKILFLFTKQLLNLQSQALDKFKDTLLKIVSDSKKTLILKKNLQLNLLVNGLFHTQKLLFLIILNYLILQHKKS
jgi:hypothetical protein